MDSTLTALNVTDLVNIRTQDIEKIFMAFRAGRGSKTPMQRLPRHMRRRAMAHQVKRMPRNWRAFALKSTQQAKHRKKPQSRFYRRRRTFADGTDPRLLKTHRWHAKRYSMIQGFGMKLPFKCFQKVQRSCVRYATKNCCVVDHSYWKIIRVKYCEGFVKLLTEMAKVQEELNFDSNRCHELVLYSSDNNDLKNCLGPVIVWKKLIDNVETMEFGVHPAVVPNLMEKWSTFSPLFFTDKARLTFYGPESLNKIVETLDLKEDDDANNLFNDVLDGGVVVGKVGFLLKGTLKNGKIIDFDLIYRSTAPEMIIDLVFDAENEKEMFYAFVHNKCRILGLADENNVRCMFGKLNFPEDAADFVDSSFVNAELEEERRKHSKRPENRRVNYEKLSKSDPFSFEWEKIVSEDDELVPIKIIKTGRGFPKRMGFIYSDVDETVEDDVVIKDLTHPLDFVYLKFDKIVPIDRLFDLKPKVKLSKRKKRKLKLDAVTKKVELEIPQGRIIGRVVRGLQWTSRQGCYYGFGYCSRKALDRLAQIKQKTIFFRNAESDKYRPAEFIILDKNQRF